MASQVHTSKRVVYTSWQRVTLSGVFALALLLLVAALAWEPSFGRDTTKSYAIARFASLNQSGRMHSASHQSRPLDPIHLNILNGSFEAGVDPGVLRQLNEGSTDIDHWLVVTGSLDYIGTYWHSS